MQIVLESFPISSSGHVLLLEKMIRYLQGKKLLAICGAQALEQFRYMDAQVVQHFLHGVTVVVIAIFFFRRWSIFFLYVRTHWRLGVKLVLLVGLADVVTAVFYFLFKIVDLHGFPVWLGFVFSASALFSLRFLSDKRYSTFTFKKALLIGAVQGIALLPGISRMGVTFVVARWLRLSNKKAFEVSFLVQWPLIFAAFLQSVLTCWAGKQFHLLRPILTEKVILLFAGCGILAFFALRVVHDLVQNNRVWIFSLYLFVPIVLWLLF